MKRIFARAFRISLPVMAGYLFLGFAFGLTLRQAGFSPAWALGISTFVYAGAMQFVLVGLLAAPPGLWAAALVTFSVNCRHLFYGLSFLEKYRDAGRYKPYLIFSLTDETYSVLGGLPPRPNTDENRLRFYISLLHHAYWVLGSVAGAVCGGGILGTLRGVEFSGTALFIVLLLERLKSDPSPVPAWLGLFAGIGARILFGPDAFIVPALLFVTGMLTLLRGRLTAPAASV